MANRPRTSPTRRFQELLSLVAEEHEVELQDLRAENQRLNEELRRLRGEVQHEVPHHSLPYSATDLRMAAAHPEPDPPHASAATLIHGDNQNPLVEVVIHGAGGLPEALLQAADGSTCQLCTTFGFEDAKSGWLPLQRDAWMSAPNMVGASEQTWEAVLTRPCRLCLQVASTFLSDDELFVELHLPGRKVALACASVKLGSQRQKWAFDRGGFLDAEVLVNGAHSVPKMVASEKDSDSDRDSKDDIREIKQAGKIEIKHTTSQRLHKIFKVKDEVAKMILARDLAKALKSSRTKGNSFQLSFEHHQLEELLYELQKIHGYVFGNEPRQSKQARRSNSAAAVLPWKSFLECLLLKNLPEFSSGQTSLRLYIMQKALLGDDLPSMGASRALVQAYEQVKKPLTAANRIVMLITLVSTVFIFINFVCTGVALDYLPGWWGWKYVDSVFGFFFIVETLLKLFAVGWREYCCGAEKWWNFFDSGISLVALVELVYNFIVEGLQNNMPTRVALTLRVLRLARVSFYMKLINTPLLQELANIVQGFLVAVPSLFWVLVTLSVVVYVSALALRATVLNISGKYYGPDVCGSGDLLDFNTTLPTGCGGIHDVYGQEYCGTVLGCMFTIFRCMIGDCTTAGGRSLTLIWSQGYGVQFDIFYSFSMVVVIFGMFNIITAIFVEATLNGLKETDAARKYAQAYESNYMTEQLGKLIMSISKHVSSMRKAEGAVAKLAKSFSWTSKDSDSSLNKEMFLTEAEFIGAIRNTDVRMLLDDLDVILEPRPGVFEAFNTEEDGTVSMSELVAGLLSFRGELQKVDVLTTKKYMENMTKELHDVHNLQSQMIARIVQIEQQPKQPQMPVERPPETSRRMVVAVPRRRIPKW